MNGYTRAFFTIQYGYLKLGLIKIFHGKSIKFGKLPRVSRNTEITVDKNATLMIGNRFNMRGTARIRVRNSGKLVIGDNVSINVNNMIACHEHINIGDDVQLSPNVQIYDHDHDFRVKGGVKEGKFQTSSVNIGNNVWIGANVVILRGTTIGDGSVVAAGCVVKGSYPENTLILGCNKTRPIKGEINE